MTDIHHQGRWLAAEIDKAGGTALAVEADLTNCAQAEAAVQQAAGRRLAETETSMDSGNP